MKKAERSGASWEGYVVAGLIIVYTAVFSFVAYMKYQSFSFHDLDLSSINQAFWNATRGRFVSHQVGESVLFSGHKWVIIILLLPLYALFASPLTLLFLQSLALGLGALAVYLFARDILNPRFGLLFSFCYLIYPALNYVNLYEFHVVAFATPLLLFTFYFYYKRRWGLFIMFILLSISVRENVAIPVCGIGLFALLQGGFKTNERFWPRFKWGLVPLFLAILWFTVCVKFTPVKSSVIIESFYAWLGGSVGEILKTILFRPGKVLSGVVIKPKLLYLLHLFVPVAFLPIFSPCALVMTLISLTEGLLSQRFTHFSIHYQYSSTVTPLLFVSAVYGIRNILRWKALAGREKPVLVVVLLFSLVSAITFGPLFRLPSAIKGWRINREDEIRQKLVDGVPAGAPVIATFGFTPKLSMRNRLFYFYHVYSVSRLPKFSVNIPEAQGISRYALVDFDDYLTFYDFYTPGGDRDVYRFLTNGNWQLVETVNSIALFKKARVADLVLIGRGDPGKLEHSLDIAAVAQIKLSGYNLSKKEVMGEGVIELGVYFQCLEKVPEDFLLLARFTSRQKPGFSFKQAFFAPYRIYPSSRWQPGEMVEQRCDILVPEGAPRGDYDMVLSLLVRGADGFGGKVIYRGSRALFLP